MQTICFEGIPTEWEEYLFWRKVLIETPTECWWWISDADNGAYGKHGWRGRIYYSHRVAWYFTHKTDPKGCMIDHVCDNTFCCNPSHLQMLDGDASESNRKNIMRVIYKWGSTQGRTECFAGHPLTEDNLYVINTKRICKTCEDYRRSLIKNFSNERVEFCRHGHEYTEENTRINKNGAQECRQCDKRVNAQRREAKNEWRRRKRAQERDEDYINPSAPISDEIKSRVIELRKNKNSQQAIADKTGISRASVSRILKHYHS